MFAYDCSIPFSASGRLSWLIAVLTSGGSIEGFFLIASFLTSAHGVH
jgi:hypothetical protein